MTPVPARGRKRIEPVNRKGYVKLRRGLPETIGEIPTSDVQWNYERLVARVGPNGAWMLVYVLDRTVSAFALPGHPPPEYTKIDPVAIADFLNVSTRHVRGIVEWLIKFEVLISRCPQDPWALKALPENFEKLPVLSAPKRPGRPSKAHRATVSASTPIAACQELYAVTRNNTGDYSQIVEAPPGKNRRRPRKWISPMFSKHSPSPKAKLKRTNAK